MSLIWMKRLQTGENERQFDDSIYSIETLQKKGWILCEPPVPPPGPTIEERRAFVISQMKSIRDSKMNGEFTYLNKQIQCRLTDRENIAGYMNLYNAGLWTPGETFAWRCADNTWLPLDLQGFLGLAGRAAEFKLACYEKAWNLDAEINASDNPESIDISSDWPV